jgi:hypothetical protein
MRRLAHAAGAWYSLTRRLALTRRAWAISDADAAALEARGYEPDPSGLGLEPPRRLFVVAEAEIGALAGAREVELRASPELLACGNLALVPFEAADATAPPRR